jgi:hypothetical protein
MVFKIVVVGSNPAFPVIFKVFDFIVDYFYKSKPFLQTFSKIYWFVYCLFYDFWSFTFSNLDIKRLKLKRKNYKIYQNYSSYASKSSFFSIISGDAFINTDLIWAKFFSLKYEIKDYKTNLFRSYFRVLNTRQGFLFYFNFLKNNNNYLFFLKKTFLSGFHYVWIGIRFWIIPLTICFLIIYCTLVLRLLPFNKIMFAWIAIIMFSYWLVSGFVFFFKKYQFGKYTSVVQRFWRRTYILFWLIEGATFSVFLFFTINSSQESFYMFDQINIYKTHLYSWRFFLLKIFPIILLIISTYLLLVSLKWNLFGKHSIWLFFLTSFLTYIVWLEFYQFFHVLNFYGNLNWIYDVDDHSWSLEQEPRRTRIVNHYVMLLFILKFWHVVFIYGFWIFFVLRCWETKRIRYPLLAANFQNFIILYIFAWVFMYPWFKFFFRKFLDTPYYWFYINNRRLGFRILFNDFKLIYYGLINNIRIRINLIGFDYSAFFYWKLSEITNNFEIYRKHVIKNRIIKSIL